MDWHPTQDIVVAVGDRISIYEVQSDVLHTIEDRAEEVLMLCVAWHPSGKFFVTGDYGDFEYHHPPLLQYWTADDQANSHHAVYLVNGNVTAEAPQFVHPENLEIEIG